MSFEQDRGTDTNHIARSDRLSKRATRRTFIKSGVAVVGGIVAGSTYVKPAMRSFQVDQVYAVGTPPPVGPQPTVTQPQALAPSPPPQVVAVEVAGPPTVVAPQALARAGEGDLTSSNLAAAGLVGVGLTAAGVAMRRQARRMADG